MMHNIYEKPIRLGGVPEHFNFPWIYGIKNNLFSANGLHIEWSDYPSGTGAMCKDLNDDKLDLAVVLTEGVVADIYKGADTVLLQWYVTSPLIWGVHTAYHSGFDHEHYLQNARFAISRFGSGSHLMAHVYAIQKNVKLSTEQFVVVNNISGAEKALTHNEADLFLWEKFTTKPWVEKKIFRCIDICPTPWPCFVMAANRKFTETNKPLISALMKTLLSCIKEVKAMKNLAYAIALHYNLHVEDVNEWLSVTNWNDYTMPLKYEQLEKVADTLHILGLIPDKNREKNYIVHPD
ncbi:MAG: ABC transporter substrate-binding protein [Cytophagaceae bacterium]|nr:ABC transporter substrate-binding protein [Cytophagaceae bacterium]MDW8455477.1 ABC transporter substrate-binding protein [Cytophagaceae bacterium]